MIKTRLVKLASLEDCQREVTLMLLRSKTKVIAPTVTLGLLKVFAQRKQRFFTEREIKKAYADAVRSMQSLLQHNLHIGAKWEDAYASRTLPKYRVLRERNGRFELLSPYTIHAQTLEQWIPGQISAYIEQKLGMIPKLSSQSFRAEVAQDVNTFVNLLETNIEINPANFEFICFAVLRIHLEKFACRIYRDTRAAAHDKGVDISTNFGVVYQIKKLRVVTQKVCDAITAELKMNFDKQRLDDGKVILVIDDIRKEFKDFLIDMKIQSITKADLLKLARQFEDPEDREKVLRVIHDEFRREYASRFD
jgi:hypothetical protein